MQTNLLKLIWNLFNPYNFTIYQQKFQNLCSNQKFASTVVIFSIDWKPGEMKPVTQGQLNRRCFIRFAKSAYNPAIILFSIKLQWCGRSDRPNRMKMPAQIFEQALLMVIGEHSAQSIEFETHSRFTVV